MNSDQADVLDISVGISDYWRDAADKPSASLKYHPWTPTRLCSEDQDRVEQGLRGVSTTNWPQQTMINLEMRKVDVELLSDWMLENKANVLRANDSLFR